MNRETVEQNLLNGVIDAAPDRDPRLAEFVRNDPQLSRMMRDYEALRGAMVPGAESQVEPPIGGWAALEQRMRQTIEGAAGADPRHPMLVMSLGRMLLWAAAVVIVMSGWIMFFAQDGGKPAATDQVAQALTPGDIARGREVFSKVASVFDGKASWVAVSKNSADMGLSATAADSPHRLLLLRLTLLEDGRTASQADVMIVAGESATVTLPLDDHRQVQYQITTAYSATGDTRLSLWAQLQRRGASDGEALAGLATQLQPHAGRVFSAGEMVSHNDRYELRVSFGESSVKQAEKEADRS